MLDAGVEVAAIADLRPNAAPSDLAEKIADAGVPIHSGHAIYAAMPNSQKNGLRGAVVAPLSADGTIDAQRGTEIACDGLVASVGWVPNAALPSQAGVQFAYDEALEQLVPQSCPDGVFVAGRVRGVYDLDAQREDGRVAGLRAAHYAGHGDGEVSASPLPVREALSHSYPIFAHPSKKNFVDFDEDLHLADFVNAHQEGYDSVELLKRYSTVGMGPSQGKLSNMNAMRILARLNGDTVAATGSTTRPSLLPAGATGAFGGSGASTRCADGDHDWHCEHGAVLPTLATGIGPSTMLAATLAATSVLCRRRSRCGRAGDY